MNDINDFPKLSSRVKTPPLLISTSLALLSPLSSPAEIIGTASRSCTHNHFSG